jgi:hypothetical protein
MLKIKGKCYLEENLIHLQVLLLFKNKRYNV